MNTATFAPRTPDMGARLYVYKITVDDGGAPCVTDELLTLGICKPAIRKTAEPGAIIFGVGANSAPLNNRLVYVAVVTGKETGGRYYEAPKYACRADCIYKRDASGEFQRRKQARFHSDQRNMERDLGAPPDYPRANVLLSTEFRYFGNMQPIEYPPRDSELAKLVERLGRGHRINHPDKLREELLALKAKLWEKYTGKSRIGTPCHPPQSALDSEGESCIEVCAPHGRILDDNCSKGC